MLRFAPYVRLLRENPAFARLYAAQLASFAGDWFATVALLGLVLEVTHSAAAASVVLFLQMAGFAVASPIAGVIADRVDRRRLMITVDLLRIPVALSLLLAGNPQTIWLAFVAVALLAMGAALFEPTSSAALPNLVEPEQLGHANVLLGSAWGTMLALGAAAGGVVAATLGREAAFIADAGTFAMSAALIMGIRRSFQRGPREQGEDTVVHAGLASAIADALRYARRSRLVASFMLSKASFGVGTGVVLMLAVFGGEVFGAGDVGIGILFAARGLGALLGPFAARAVVGLEDRGLLIGIVGSLAVVIACYALFPLMPTIWLAAVMVFGAHLGGGAQWMLSTFGLQRAAPDHIRGRLFSVDYGLVTTVIAISTLLAGAIAEALPPHVAVWTMVVLVAISGSLWALFSRPLWHSGA